MSSPTSSDPTARPAASSASSPSSAAAPSGGSRPSGSSVSRPSESSASGSSGSSGPSTGSLARTAAPAPQGGGPARAGRLFLVRHGRTPWAAAGQHTGRTDVLLDDVGRRQAQGLGATLERLREGRHAPARVLSSPLQRAYRTAELAGLNLWRPIEVVAELQEWDYGAYEGLTTPQVRALHGDDWRALRDGVEPGGPGQPPGETLEEVAERCDRVLASVTPSLARGDVVLVGHGHALRILTARWLELPPRAAERFVLGPASISVLGHEHEVPGIELWNITPGLLTPAG